MKLSDLTLNTEIFQSIIAPNTHAEFKTQTGHLKLSMSVSGPGTIEGICLKQEGFDSFIPYFTLLRLMLLKQNIDQVFHLSWDELIKTIEDKDDHPIFALPLYLMRHAASKYLGKPSSFCFLKNIEPRDLVCHCFGVTYKDIDDKTKTGGTDYDFRKLQEDLLISSGCGSCLQKANEHFKTAHSKAHSGFQIIDGHGLLFWARKMIQDLNENELSSEMIKNRDGEIKIETSNEGRDFLKQTYSDELLGSLL